MKRKLAEQDEMLQHVSDALQKDKAEIEALQTQLADVNARYNADLAAIQLRLDEASAAEKAQKAKFDESQAQLRYATNLSAAEHARFVSERNTQAEMLGRAQDEKKNAEEALVRTRADFETAKARIEQELSTCKTDNQALNESVSQCMQKLETAEQTNRELVSKLDVDRQTLESLRAEIERLTREKAALEEEKKQLLERIKRLEAERDGCLADLAKKIENIRSNENTVLRGKIAVLEEELRKLTATLQDCTQQRTECNALLTTCDNKLRERTVEFDALKQKYDALLEKQQQMTQDYNALKADSAAKTKSFNEQKAELQADLQHAKAEHAHAAESYLKTADERDVCQQANTKLKEEQKQHVSEAEALKAQNELLRQQLEEAQRDLQTSQSKYSDLEAERNTMKNEEAEMKRSYDLHIKDLTDSLKAANTRLHAMSEMKEEQEEQSIAAVALADLRNRIQDIYLTYEPVFYSKRKGDVEVSDQVHLRSIKRWFEIIEKFIKETLYKALDGTLDDKSPDDIKYYMQFIEDAVGHLTNRDLIQIYTNFGQYMSNPNESTVSGKIHTIASDFELLFNSVMMTYQLSVRPKIDDMPSIPHAVQEIKKKIGKRVQSPPLKK